MPELSLEERNCKNIALFNIFLFLLSYFLMSTFMQSLFLYITDLKLSPHLFLALFLTSCYRAHPMSLLPALWLSESPNQARDGSTMELRSYPGCRAQSKRVHLRGSISEEGRSSDKLSTFFLERGQAEGHVLGTGQEPCKPERETFQSRGLEMEPKKVLP